MTRHQHQSTLLCIHREPAQLSLLKEKGYRLITSTNGGDGLRLLMSRGADAIILDYYVGLPGGVLDGSVIAAEIKQLRPKPPIVMLADHVELPEGALKSVDALVAKSDGPHFLLATVHSVLKSTPARQGNLRAQTLADRRSGRSREGVEDWQANTSVEKHPEWECPILTGCTGGLDAGLFTRAAVPINRSEESLCRPPRSI